MTVYDLGLDLGWSDFADFQVLVILSFEGRDGFCILFA